MKNIFLLPSKEKSNLYKFKTSGVVRVTVKPIFVSGETESQFVYIIDDEKIEDGNWVFQECLNMPHRLIKTDTENVKVLNDLNKCKKIVLTNDTSLIEDGVQSIDDEFLEWFVKNPSCEEVEIESKLTKDGVWTDLKGYVELPTIHSINYKIIIPKEEQKQHIIEMMQNDEELGLYGENIIDTWLEKYGNPEIMKQVEKEAELYQTINKIIDGGKNLPKGFEVSRGQAIDYAFDVALEVAEKLYTEEDLHNAFYNGWIYRGENYTFPKAKKEWFDENKK